MKNCSGEICVPGNVCLEGCGGVKLLAPRCLGKKLLKRSCASIKSYAALVLVLQLSVKGIKFKILIFFSGFK